MSTKEKQTNVNSADLTASAEGSSRGFFHRHTVMLPLQITVLSSLMFLLTFPANRVCLGSEDDVESSALPPPIVRPQLVGRIVRQDFDQWFNGDHRNIVQSRFEMQVRTYVYELTRKHAFSQEQQAKLNLAARSDLNRYRREVDELRVKFDSANDKQNVIQSLVEERDMLRNKQLNLLGPTSFAAKAIRNILTAEQRAKEHADLSQRSRTRCRPIIERSIREIERQLELHEHQRFNDHQREALVKLWLDQSYLPELKSDFDDIVVKYQLSRVPEKSLKSLFEENQWPHVYSFYNRYQAYGPRLAQMSLIVEEATEPQQRRNDTDQSNNPADATRPESSFDQAPNVDDKPRTIIR